jgi:serine-type D-Ala-D-Ala carboxypeptidase (penicillin-binding protein 5/6)
MLHRKNKNWRSDLSLVKQSAAGVFRRARDHRRHCSLAALAALAALPGFIPVPAMAQAAEPPLTPPPVQAASAILMDAATGTILWEKNARTRRPNASTTKIMAATMMIESGRLSEKVAFSQVARATPYANLNAKPGEKFVMRDLLYAVMLRSSNDSCVAIGEHLSGSARQFAREMTQRARELGALDTNFVTTNGLYHEQHYSTAYDLALMTRHAVQYPLFNEVVGTRQTSIPRAAGDPTLLKNGNKLLARYQGADGVKTGYVRQSGRCLVSSATHFEEGHPWRLITVVLNSADTYADSEAMLEWGRENFQPVYFARGGEQLASASVRGGNHGEVPLIAKEDLLMIVPRRLGNNTEREVRVLHGLRAPVLEDQVAGTVVGLVEGRPVGQVDLVAAQPVAEGQMQAGLLPWSGAWLVLGFGVLGTRYARAFAKGARRRRRGFTAGCRGADPEGEGDR